MEQSAAVLKLLAEGGDGTVKAIARVAGISRPKARALMREMERRGEVFVVTYGAGFCAYAINDQTPEWVRKSAAARARFRAAQGEPPAPE